MSGNAVVVGPRGVEVVVVPQRGPTVVVGQPGQPGPLGPPGPPGAPGPPGPEGGTPVVAVPYDQWPPAAPQPNTLYLRLAP